MLNVSAVAGAYVPKSYLTDTVKTAVENGMLDMNATVTDVVLIAIPVIIGVIGLTVGANFAVSKIRSIASWAS